MQRQCLTGLLLVLILLAATLCGLEADALKPKPVKLHGEKRDQTSQTAPDSETTADPETGPMMVFLPPVQAPGDAAEPLNGPLRDSLTMTASISGAIGYFAGQTNSSGQTLPVDENRYLAGEKILLILDFGEEPGIIEVTLNGQIWRFYGISGRLHYETSLIIPDWPSTLSWSGERLSAPLTLTIRATARSDPSVEISQAFPGIELTGHVLELVQGQPVRN